MRSLTGLWLAIALAAAGAGGNVFAVVRAERGPGAAIEHKARLSELVGAPVRSATGEDVGKAKDLVIDMRGRKVVFALVAAGPGAPARTCVVGAGGLALREAELVLPPAARSVDAVPSCSSSAWFAPETEPLRYLRASELPKVRVVDAAGQPVGRVEDVVVEVDDARLEYAIARLEAAQGVPAEISPVEVRPIREAGGGLAMELARVDP